MRTRFATPDDAEAIGRIHTVAWQVGYEHVFGAENLATIDEAARRARWRERLDGGGARAPGFGVDVQAVELGLGGAVVLVERRPRRRPADDLAGCVLDDEDMRIVGILEALEPRAPAFGPRRLVDRREVLGAEDVLVADLPGDRVDAADRLGIGGGRVPHLHPVTPPSQGLTL